MARFLRSKAVQLSLVLLLAASVVATGAYAWSGFLGRSTVFTPNVAPPEVVLVDFTSQMGEVYVVNNTGQEVLVRVRLAQYLSVNGVPVGSRMLEEDPSTWALTPNQEILKYYRLIPGGSVLPMEDWKARGAPEGDYWVSDGDGWYYYARRLSSGETTRTLIQEVAQSEFNVLLDGDYRIEATLQAVPREELHDLLALDPKSFTSDGATLMKYLDGELVEFG